MTGPHGDDMERLASLLALLPSEDGEAENAGRALGQLARRLGLSGGDLKTIFQAGVQAGAVPPPAEPGPEGEAGPETVSEVDKLRHLLDGADDERRRLAQRLEALQDENEHLHETLDQSRIAGRLVRVAGAVVLAAALVGGGLAWFGPSWRAPVGLPSADPGSPRMAEAGAAGARLFSRPDFAAPVLQRVAAGTKLPVHGLLWRDFTQWMQTEQDGAVAFAPAAEVDLR